MCVPDRVVERNGKESFREGENKNNPTSSSASEQPGVVTFSEILSLSIPHQQGQYLQETASSIWCRPSSVSP